MFTPEQIARFAATAEAWAKRREVQMISTHDFIRKLREQIDLAGVRTGAVVCHVYVSARRYQALKAFVVDSTLQYNPAAPKPHNQQPIKVKSFSIQGCKVHPRFTLGDDEIVATKDHQP